MAGSGATLNGPAPAKMVPDGKGGYINAAEAGLMNATAPNLQATPEQHASYTGPEFSKSTPNGSGVDYYSPGAPSAGVPASAAPLTGVGGAVGAPGATPGGTNIQGGDAFAGLNMAAQGEQNRFLGSQTGALRPLGTRTPAMESMALAGLGRKVY